MILSNFVPILAQYLDSALVEEWFFPLLALSFVATVPCIIKQLLR